MDAKKLTIIEVSKELEMAKDDPFKQMEISTKTLPVFEVLTYPMTESVFVPVLANMLDEWLEYNKLPFSKGKEILESIISVRDTVNEVTKVHVADLTDARNLFI